MEIILDLNYEFKNFVFEEYLDKINKDRYLEKYISNILEIENIISDKPIYISLMLTDNKSIQIVNKEYRQKDMPTDVISFAYHDNGDFDIGPYDTLGDIIISLERVNEQRIEYNHSFEREFFYVLTHGMLHLLGYDHIDENDKKIMRDREEFILNKFGYRRNNEK